MPDSRDYDKQVYGPSIQAVCPRCGNSHKLRLNWIGHGVPRIFCPQCRSAIDRNSALSSDDVDHTINFAPHFSRTPVKPSEKVAISEMHLIPHYR